MLSLTVVDVLSLACLVAAVHCASLSSINLGRDVWLEDFEKIAQQKGAESTWMQADSPMSSNKKRDRKATSSNNKDVSDSPRCPQVGDDCDTSASSDLIKCQTDDDCTSFIGRKCCHDGCRLVCLVAEPPPPYIDWQYEPRVQFAPGNSWLIRGSDEEAEVDWCSTSYVYDETADEDPLLCPHGYICQLDDSQNDIIPNRGRCVRKPPDPVSEEENLFRLSDSRAKDGSCVVSSDQVYSDGQTFRYGRHMCKCEAGSVMCRVGKTLPVS